MPPIPETPGPPVPLSLSPPWATTPTPASLPLLPPPRASSPVPPLTPLPGPPVATTPVPPPVLMPVQPVPATPVLPSTLPIPITAVPPSPLWASIPVPCCVVLNTKRMGSSAAKVEPPKVSGTVTPSGEPAVPLPIKVWSCTTVVTPLFAKSTIDTVVYGRLPLTEPVNRDEKLTFPVPSFAPAVKATSTLTVSPYENGFV